MIARLSPSKSEHKRAFFQMRSADKVTSEIGIFKRRSYIERRLYIKRRS